MYKTPKVTLLTHTELPLETIYAVWDASKSEGQLKTPQEVRDTVTREEVVELFKSVIAQRIPVGEHVDFVFMLENVSVSWREQAVRHRIGTKISPESLGLDIIPDLADSSFWSQSMRIQNMGNFAHSKSYRMPQTVLDAGEKAEGLFNRAMGAAEYAYNELVKMGVPMEDARETIPLGAHHRISWKLNIGALQHIVGKRSCFILQLGIWGPIIRGMIEELGTVDSAFRDLVSPPCVDEDGYVGCVYHEECRRRIDGRDELPPCPLHLAQEMDIECMHSIPMEDAMRARADQYASYWGRNPYTGEKLPTIDNVPVMNYPYPFVDVDAVIDPAYAGGSEIDMCHDCEGEGYCGSDCQREKCNCGKCDGE